MSLVYMVLDVHTRYIHVYADPATHTATVYDYVQPAKVMLVYFAKKNMKKIIWYFI